MPVWSVLPVINRPTLTLVSWSIYQVPSFKDPSEPERHFIGYSLEDRQGQVSSAIQAFDPDTACGVTRSGRVYHLKGRPGANGDAAYTWERWKSLNKVTEQIDVTDEVLAQMLTGQNGVLK